MNRRTVTLRMAPRMPAEDEDEDGKATNRAPVVSSSVSLPDVFGCAVAIIGLSELLRNATDPDGDALVIKNLSVSSGTLTQQGGSWAFVADGTGPVTISYSVSDGEMSVAQTAHFEVHRAAPIVGTGQ